jgi:hypothetical protein
MNLDQGHTEVVWIKDEYRLIDGDGHERTYGVSGSRDLVPGYYVAHWPPGTQNPHFLHDGLSFVGPYRDSALALLEPDTRLESAA